MCTIAVCGLAHMLEAHGISTVVIGLVPQHVGSMRPPRSLLVPFELGRPFGFPGDPEKQTQVLAAAMALLNEPGPGPIVEEFESDWDPAEPPAETWACPVSFPTPPDTTLTGRLTEEVRALRPWFDRARKDRGRTGADVSTLEPEALCTFLASFLGSTTPTDSPVPERTLAETFKLAVEDLKAFYLEAVTAQPSAAATGSPTLNDWFWNETAAGELLWALREHLADAADEGIRLHAAFTLVPQLQVARRQNL